MDGRRRIELWRGAGVGPPGSSGARRIDGRQPTNVLKVALSSGVRNAGPGSNAHFVSRRDRVERKRYCS